MNENDLLEKPKSKAKLLKVLIVLLIVVLFLVIIVFGLYKGFVDVSNKYNEKYDDIPTLVNEYTNKGTDIINTLEYDKETKNAKFIFSKGFIYSTFDYQSRIDSFKKDLELDIKRFGYDVDPKNKLINIYTDFIYKERIHSCIKAQIEYIIDTDAVRLVLKEYEIGNKLPKEWFNDILPYKVGDTIYTFKLSDIDGLEKLGFDLKYLDNIEYVDNTNIIVQTNLEDLALEVIDYYIKSLGIDTSNKTYQETIGQLIPSVVDSILSSLETTDIKTIIEKGIETFSK